MSFNCESKIDAASITEFIKNSKHLKKLTVRLNSKYLPKSNFSNAHIDYDKVGNQHHQKYVYFPGKNLCTQN